jgi:arginine/lysine/ornithine decarboxylase
VYSAGGSSQSINAMVFLAKMRSNSKTILAGRNAHKAFLYACAKIDVDVDWMYPDKCTNLCSCIITPELLKKSILKAKEKPFAVYITSPDYLGKMSDIKSLSAICQQYEIPLLVDNAHGAYLAFCEENYHPIHLGADICCDSAHKTLPVLTGGGYLHIASSDLYGFSSYAVQAMGIFGSTSPSYLILQSLDLCNKYIAENIKEDIDTCCKKVNEIRELMPVPDLSREPLKITADLRQVANKNAFFDIGIEPEYFDGELMVFMFTPQNIDEDYERLKKAFSVLQIKKDILNDEIPILPSEQKISIRAAVFSQSETVSIKNAMGRICASPTVSCPPAIPIAVSGEIINHNHIQLFEKYNIKNISVVKK